MTDPTFFFYQAQQSETVFDEHTMSVNDLQILSFDLVHEEGQICTLDITIKNPRVGLLTMPVWAWLAYNPPSNSIFFGHAPIPLFFGVLIGIPSDLFKETISIRYQARSVNFIANKQAMAEQLKVLGPWDPVFLDERTRDDPDSILASGWSGLYHYSRLPEDGDFITTFSDILEGEEGTQTFYGNMALYDSVSMTIGESPLAGVQVQARVKWTQRTWGWIPLPGASAAPAGGGSGYPAPTFTNPYTGQTIPSGLGNYPTTSVASYTGETFMNDWPKPGTSFGGGWRCEWSFVDDVYHVGQTPTYNVHNSYSNTSLFKAPCTTDSLTYSLTFPAVLSPNPLSGPTSEQGQGFICDPFGNPPIIRGAVVNIGGVVIPQWFLNCQALLRYDAKRDFVEEVVFNVTTNTQAVLTSPLIQQNTETITLDGSDVGEPLLTYFAWSDFAGKAVTAGTVIFPNNPTTPGGLAYQVCVVSGIAGTVEPTFSVIPGTEVTDGTVVWASVGPTPAVTIPVMAFATSYSSGAILVYYEQTFDYNTGQLVNTGVSGYYLIVGGGSTSSALTPITYVPPVLNTDEPTPVPVTVFVPLFSPIGIPISAPWLDIPIGGTPLNVTARCYFPTVRGMSSVQNLIYRARARLRKKARAVTLKWDCPFDYVLFLSCRMNATLFDPRLPGGVATGKVVRYSMHADGRGKMRGHVEIGVPVGLGGSIPAITGTPDYVEEGYVEPGYQTYSGAQYTTAEEDIGYTPLYFAPFDDGLSFPLQTFPGTISISNTASAQVAPLTAAILATLRINQLDLYYSAAETAGAAWIQEEINFYNIASELPYVMQANAVSADIVIQPVTNGPFSGSYSPTVTPLQIPKGIDLEAPSNE